MVRKKKNMSAHEQLERTALTAHARGDTWATFWRQHGDAVAHAEPYHRGRYRRLVAKLLHLVVSGNPSGMEPAGEPWLLDEQPQAVAPDDTATRARIDWTAAGIAQEPVG